MILAKSVNANHSDWLRKLYHTRSAHRMTIKTPTGMSPYQLVFCKACHLPVEIECKELLALKHLNL